MATAKVAARQIGNDNKVGNGLSTDNDSINAAAIIRMLLYQMVLPRHSFTTDALAEIMVTAGVREGDSLITITKDNKGTAFKILKVYLPGENGLNTDSLIALDKSAELKLFTAAHAQMADKRINAYLQKRIISPPLKPMTRSLRKY